MSKRKRPLPNFDVFDSPPRSAAGKKEPPDVRQTYDNRREPSDPEMMETMQLWEAPEMILGRVKNINRAFIIALEYELIPSQTESYTAEQISEIQHIIANLVANAVTTPFQLLRRIADLTVSVSEDVRNNLTDLAYQFYAIAGGESDVEMDQVQLRL